MKRREALKAIADGLLGTASSALTILDPTKEAGVVASLCLPPSAGLSDGDFIRIARLQVELVARNLGIPSELIYSDRPNWRWELIEAVDQ